MAMLTLNPQEASQPAAQHGTAASVGPRQQCRWFPAITCPQLIPFHYTGKQVVGWK